MKEESHSIAAVVLAAGSSRRFGGDKLLYSLGGTPVLEHVFLALRDCAVDLFCLTVVPVAGCRHRQVAEKYGSMVLENQQHRDGMGSSIATAAKFLQASTALTKSSGVMIVLGDMPRLQPSTIRELIEQFENFAGEKIVRPVFNSQAGHPVIFPNEFIDELAGLNGDQGAAAIIRKNIDQLQLVHVNDVGAVFDIDERRDVE